MNEETGITEATLYKWRKEARAGGSAKPVMAVRAINGAARINF